VIIQGLKRLSTLLLLQGRHDLLIGFAHLLPSRATSTASKGSSRCWGGMATLTESTVTVIMCVNLLEA